MCGIVGVIAKKFWGFSTQHKKMFENMLFVDSIRGDDATGIYLVNKEGNVDWVKSTEASFQYWVDSKEPTSVLNDMVMHGLAVVGHNRKATIGVLTDENAHPFIAGNSIMVHNGTLRNHKSFGYSHAVDSEIFTNLINDIGIEKAVGAIDGAFAIAQYNAETKQVSLIRNMERPLWLCEMEDAWAFASEPWMAYGMAWRNQLKVVKMTEIDPGLLHTFTLGEDETTLETKKLDLYKPPPYIPPPKKEVVIDQSKLPVPSSARVHTFPKENGEYKRGDIICFVPDKHIILNDKRHRIEGMHFLGKWKISCFIGDKMSHEEVADLCKEEVLSATVISTVIDRVSGINTMYVEDIMINDSFYSINGTEINHEILFKIPGQCLQCKRQVGEDEYDECFIKVKPSGKLSCTCPTCVETNILKNPKWGGEHVQANYYRTIQAQQPEC